MRKKPSQPTDEQLLRRALAAYFRSKDLTLASISVPQHSKVETYRGLKYVLIRGQPDRRAKPETWVVYRVRNDGMLRRMKRWPAYLNFDKGASS